MTGVLRVLAAAAVLLATAGPLAAQTVLMKEGNLTLLADDRRRESVCTLILEPDAGGTGRQPRIVLRSAVRTSGRRPAPRMQLLIDAPRGAKKTFAVIGDRRIALTEREDFDPTDRRRPPVLDALASARDIHITSRMADGSYLSARFDGRDLGQVFATLRRRCQVDIEPAPGGDGEAVSGVERHLSLSRRDLRRITFLLHSRYDRTLEPPSFAGELSSATRNLLERYSRAAGMAPTRHLSRELADRLSLERYRPRRWSHSGDDNFQRTRDWYVYTRGNGRNRRCFLESEATRATGALIWQYPHMRLTAHAGQRDATMYIDLVTPNVLDTRRRRPLALVDGERFYLAVRSGSVLPIRSSGSFASEFVRAVRRGRQIVITGQESETGDNIRLEFSARGFTAGFRAMMQACDRPDLEAWL